MSDTIERSVLHDTFVIERVIPATKDRVFAAFSDPETKAKWFGAANSGVESEFDFREGGRERNRGEHYGTTYEFDSRYLDIVENERIAYSYNMYVDGVKLSSSLTVVELTTVPDGTKLVFTETGAYYDGHQDTAERRTGSIELMAALAALFAED